MVNCINIHFIIHIRTVYFERIYTYGHDHIMMLQKLMFYTVKYTGSDDISEIYFQCFSQRAIKIRCLLKVWLVTGMLLGSRNLIFKRVLREVLFLHVLTLCSYDFQRLPRIRLFYLISNTQTIELTFTGMKKVNLSTLQVSP